MTNLSREDELLIHCARLDLSEERRRSIKDLLADKLDWDLLLKKAVWHRLLLLISHHLGSPDLRVLVPEPVLEKLKSFHYQSLTRNMVLQNELSHLLSAFNSQDIPVIVLKGAALLENVYRDISLRPMNDIDILVRPEHLDLAEAIALQRGYTYLTAQDTPKQTKKSGRHLDNMLLREKNIFLEIHEHIVNTNDPCHFDLNGFWTRAEPVTISGAHALALAPGDLLLHLSIKFLLDRRYQSNNALGQLCDISEVIGHYNHSLNWELIKKISQEQGFLKGLYFVLYTCQHLLQAPIPESILDIFHPQEFNHASAELFIHRRVLDTRPWLAHGLLDSQMALNHHSMIQVIVSRFFHFISKIIGPADFKRGRDILPRLGRVLLKPAELKRDLQIDRWLHDLYSTN